MNKIIMNMVASLCLLLSIPAITDNKETHEVFLTSEMIHFLDGKAIGINAAVIKRMLQVRREIKKLQMGEQTRTGTIEGHFVFHKQKHTIHSLAALESQYEMDFYQKESECINRGRNNNERLVLEAGYNETKKQLKEVLAIARNEFEAKILPFEENIRGVKEQMIVLIEESCQKHNRADCFLLKWARADKGTEMEYFHDQVTTFKALDQFCTDFIHFLDDVMRSSPKAMAQFKKLLDDQHARR